MLASFIILWSEDDKTVHNDIPAAQLFGIPNEFKTREAGSSRNDGRACILLDS